MLTNVTELLKIQMRMIICWYFGMLKMEIYIIIYRKILEKLLGEIKSSHFIAFQMGKVFIFIILQLFNIKLIIRTKVRNYNYFSHAHF